MNIHGELTAASPQARKYLGVLNSSDACDGGFSRVVPLSPTDVIKATSCEATNLLFAELDCMRKSGAAPVMGLPLVLGKLPGRVHSVDGVAFDLWRVERLFEPGNESEMIKARVYRRGEALKRRGFEVAALHAAGLDTLRSALLQEQETCGGSFGWKACSDIALAMALRAPQPLKEAFLFLQSFVARHRLELDLLTKGNVMVNLVGQPCLSDPVAQNFSTEDEFSEGLAGTCLVAWVPTAIQGVRCFMEPRGTLPLDQTDLSQVQQELSSQGVEPTELQWGSSEHLRFLSQPGKWAPVWDIPGVAFKLRAGVFEGVF